VSEISFLSIATVLRRTGLSRATVYRLVQRGEFPKPYPLSAGRVGWSSREVEDWIAARLRRDGEEGEG
jgi:prophage regulatory protein